MKNHKSNQLGRIPRVNGIEPSNKFLNLYTMKKLKLNSLSRFPFLFVLILLLNFSNSWGQMNRWLLNEDIINFTNPSSNLTQQRWDL